MKSRSIGTVFKIDGVAVGSLTSIGGVEASSETVDVTALDNTDGYKEFLGGFKDGGEIPLEGYMDSENAGQEKLLEAFEDQEVHDFAIDFPEAIGKSWTGKAVVTKYTAGSASLNDPLKFASGLKISGKPTLAATANPAQEG